MKQNVSKKLSNALAACSNGAEEAVIKAIEHQATNPFLIYSNDYVAEEVLVDTIKREGTCSKQEIAAAIQDLISRGALSEKSNFFTGRRRYSVTRAAIFGNITP